MVVISTGNKEGLVPFRCQFTHFRLPERNYILKTDFDKHITRKKQTKLHNKSHQMSTFASPVSISS